MKNFLPDVNVRKYGTFVAVVVIFVHNFVVNKDMPCTCKKGDGIICTLYMIIPSFILFILQLWTEEKFTRIWKYSCRYKWRFWIDLIYDIIKAICVGLLWVLATLIEGDWYVCCNITYNQTYTDLACKNEKTDDERKKIAEMKISSMVSFSCLYTLSQSVLFFDCGLLLHQINLCHNIFYVKM